MFKKNSFLVRKKVSLKKYSTFFIGGKADYLIIVKKRKELTEAIREIKNNNLCFFVLGGGSNVLFNDDDFKGVVLKIEMNGIEIKNKESIKVESGTRLSQLVSFCLKNELSGFEWAFGIPGTVGGAIKGNAGAFKKSMKDSVDYVEAYNIETEKIESIDKKRCQFKYRESLFKKNSNYIILGAKMKVKKRKKSLIEKEMKFFLNQRKQKQPCGFSSGSVFKNYEIKNKKESILKKFPETKKVMVENMIPAAYLIESCGLKEKRIGDAEISNIHANFIINLGKAKSSDVKKLINVAKKEVEKKFKIKLQEEIIIF